MKQLFHRASFLRVTLIGVVVAMSTVLLSCEIEHTKIPDCPVYLIKDIYDDGLLPQPSFLYVTTSDIERYHLGYAGILIVHCNDIEEPYCAFDIACPNCVSPSIRVSVPDSSTLVCACPVCGENYELIFGLGNPIKRISKVGMKKYTAYINPFDDTEIVVEP